MTSSLRTAFQFCFRQLYSTSTQRHYSPTELTVNLLGSPEGQASARTLRARLLGSQRSSVSAIEELRSSLSDAIEQSFSRSSGKGVNTKASLRVRLSKLRQHLPAYWITNLSQSHLYAPTSDSIIIQSSLTRSQASNLDDCWKKLYEALWQASEIGLIANEKLKKSSAKMSRPIVPNPFSERAESVNRNCEGMATKRFLVHKPPPRSNQPPFKLHHTPLNFWRFGPSTQLISRQIRSTTFIGQKPDIPTLLCTPMSKP
ncbi:hypothetical protein CROQUDRAFT_89454 [Cronartium quercuum f. sp. fusiforme G11]|uniref:Uncharacterized protein n=1 Tax=Cronartium quercuum f. sp. fusiforme G11 TaxID=708437 RepID=A0A9P6NNG4_9BASI|nr:hypothetical protein CROQUDRAFT_89454 [Cronartium quercuum f. sp. fusiforme G11]